MGRMARRKKLVTVPAFNQIPFLEHGFGTGDWKEEDFWRVRKWQDFRILWLKQVHSEVVHFVEEIPGEELHGDALVTELPRLFLVIKSADCLPALLVDKKKRVIAAVHCGWRGTLLRVLEKTVLGLKTHYRCSPRDLLVALGPCIQASCYQVGEEVRERFAAAHFPESVFQPVSGSPKKYLLDLKKANRYQLHCQFIPEANIFPVDICTHCDTRFPSFRRDKEKTGRMLSFIGLSA